MPNVSEIESAIQRLEGGAYQKLMDSYLYKRYGYRINSYGSQIGTNKTVKGTPDTYAELPDGKYVYVMYGTHIDADKKLLDDFSKCMAEIRKIGFENKVEKIICCHTATHLSNVTYEKLNASYGNLEIIGITETAHDLLYKYPEIAERDLGIKISTGQILDEQGFINACERNSFSTTLDMPLLFREKECSEVLELLSKNKLTIIFGQSGTGKTRLAMEVLKQYSSEHSCNVKYIKNNGENIYSDVHSAFNDDCDFAVLIDDADQLAGINHLLDTAFDRSRKHDFRILITVRDYQYHDLEETIQKYDFNPASYELKVLSEKDIKEILKNNLGITNPDYIDRISQIAKGNVRIALMAGKISLEDGAYDNLRNIFDIYDGYYSNVLKMLDKKQKVVAGLIAFLGRVRLNSRVLINTAKIYGVSESELLEICQFLDTNEIVYIFNDEAVKFDNQNFADYLLYYVFIKEKLLSISEVSKAVLDYSFDRVCYVFSTVYALFQSDTTLEYIHSQALCVWNSLKDYPDRAEKFICRFITLLPDEGIAYIKRAIDKLPQKTADFSEIDWSKKSGGNCKSSILNALANLKYTDYCKDSLDLILYFLNRNSEYPNDYCYIFGKRLSIDYDSFKYKYCVDRDILSRLSDKFQEDKSTNLGYCLLFLIESDLKLVYKDYSWSVDNCFTTRSYRLIKCDEVLSLRRKSLEMLFSMRLDKRFEQFVNHILINYPSECDGGSIDILEQDMNVVENCFVFDDSTQAYKDLLIMWHLDTVCEEYGIDIEPRFALWKNNSMLAFCLDVFVKMRTLSTEYETWKKERDKKIIEAANSFSTDDFEQMFVCMKEIGIERIWRDASNSIRIMLENVPSANYVGFVKACLKSWVRTDYSNYLVCLYVEKLLTVVDYKTAEDIISEADFTDKPLWLSSLRCQVPDCEITEAFVNDILDNVITDQKTLNPAYVISYKAIKRIELSQSGFATRYIGTIAEVSIPSALCSRIISDFCNEENDFSTMLDSIFGGRVDLLEKVYLTAAQCGEIYQEPQNLLTRLLKADPDLLDRMSDLEIANSHNLNPTPVLDVIWKLPDCKEYVVKVVRYLSRQIGYEAESALSRFIAYESCDSEEVKKNHIAVIRSIVDDYAFDEEFIERFFEAVRGISDDERLMVIVEFCRKNKDLSAFKKCPFKGKVQSATSYAEIVLERIKFFEKLKSELKGIEFTEHREYLSNIINNEKKNRQEAEVSDFIYD